MSVRGAESFTVRRWRVLAALSAGALYVVSVSGAAYEMTTPVEMAHHVLLRKVYAVAAFALLGFLLEKSCVDRLRGVLRAAFALTLYSYAIELGQIVFDHADETFGQHWFDVASGLVGGALGAFAVLLFRAPRESARRFEALAIGLAVAALVWDYLLTYALVDVARPVR